MKHELAIPEDPLRRFIEIADAVAEKKRWFQGWSMLRFAAMGLLTVPGDPRQLVERMYGSAEDLKERMGWTSSLRGDIRFCLASSLVKYGGAGKEFADILESTRSYFREAKLRRSEVHEALAILVMSAAAPDGRPTRDAVFRMAQVFEEMRKHHRHLTNADDYPAAALLAQRGEEIDVIFKRIESLYESLRKLGFQRGNQLQLATHLLYFSDQDDHVLQERFHDLYKGFKQEGLHMNSGDYDEIAILCYLDHSPETVIHRLLEDRETLRGRITPKPSKQEGFTLASTTAFIGLLVRDRDLNVLTDAMQLAQIVTLIQAQQAAAVAASTSFGAVAVSS